MPIFKRPDPATFAGLDDAVGRKTQVLAHGVGDDVVLAGTRDELAFREGDTWQVWPWERVAGGSWKGESNTFRWRTVEGDKFTAVLDSANRLPELFRERVEASTVVQGVFDAPDRGQVQIIGRRGLGADQTIHWYAVPSGGADLADPATREMVVAESDRLANEYF